MLTSSGHGGRFSFGVISRAEAASSAAFVDAALDAAFGVKSKKTLAINCLPMGVVVSSHCMTVATTSVREDMAVALVKTFGDGYEQIVLIGDPLFMKRLTDHAVEQGLDWRRYRVNAVIGEETFGEHFRRYHRIPPRPGSRSPGGGHIMSSFGVGELGLHLCFETAATAALVRATGRIRRWRATCWAGAVRSRGSWQPMILAFDPRADLHRGRGPGRATATARWRSPCSIRAARCRCSATRPATWLACSIAIAWPPRSSDHGVSVDEIPQALLALRGRAKEALPNGSQVGVYKDALYANPELARQFTGATRLIFTGDRFTMHVQLVRGLTPDAGAWSRSCCRRFPPASAPHASGSGSMRSFRSG